MQDPGLTLGLPQNKKGDVEPRSLGLFFLAPDSSRGLSRCSTGVTCGYLVSTVTVEVPTPQSTTPVRARGLRLPS